MLATGKTTLGETDAILCRDTLKLLSALKQKPIYGGCRWSGITQSELTLYDEKESLLE